MTRGDPREGSASRERSPRRLTSSMPPVPTVDLYKQCFLFWCALCCDVTRLGAACFWCRGAGLCVSAALSRCDVPAWLGRVAARFGSSAHPQYSWIGHRLSRPSPCRVFWHGDACPDRRRSASCRDCGSSGSDLCGFRATVGFRAFAGSLGCSCRRCR